MQGVLASFRMPPIKGVIGREATLIPVDIPDQNVVVVLKLGKSAGGKPCIDFAGSLKLTKEMEKILKG